MRSAAHCFGARRRDEAEAFDRRFGTDTGWRLSLDALAAEGDDAPALWRYWPSAAGPFHELLDAAEVAPDDVFVDLGSGKGRALLMAASYPFRKLIGVELSPSLHEVARKNLARVAAAHGGARRFELVCGDAADWEPPTAPLLVYLFQPFPVETLRAVLARLAESLERAPRRVTLAYLNPLFHDAVVRDGRFREARRGGARTPGEFPWVLYSNRR